MTEIELYKDERVRKFAKDFVLDLIKSFGTTIETKFGGDIERYKKCRIAYAKLLEKAKDKKKLDNDTVGSLKKLRKLFTSNFALPRKLQMMIYDKQTKKHVRVSKTVLRWYVYVVSKGIFKLHEHGRDAYSGYQFKNYYTVKFSEIDRLMKFIHKMRINNENAKQKETNH